MNRPPAIIFDRDGTLASCFARPADRSDGAWAAFNAALPFDRPVPVIAALLRAIRPGVTRIMVSGRAAGDFPGDLRRWWAMRDWIVKHDLPIDAVFMRAGGDRRVDSAVKADILNALILPRWDVRFAVDDRQSIVDVWRNHGIPVLHVTDPDLPPLIGAP